jgi:hypothetical protein
MFIRDLVNNLNQDNEVLHDNSQDLKTAFMFLLNEHKQLQFQYEKEKRNDKLVELYRERLSLVTQERDESIDLGLKLKAKVELMNDVMKVAVEENMTAAKESDQIIDQLEEENKHLRDLLQIHVDMQNQESISKGMQELTEQLEKQSQVNDSIESEINTQLLTYEQEVQRSQEDYLLVLREE